MIMPTYNFLNNDTGEESTEFMMISELDDFITNNQHLTLQVSAPSIHSGRGIGKASKPDDSFRDILRKIKKGNSKGFTKSTINTF
jgi:hypothetical protein